MNKIMKQFGMAACALFLGSSMSGRAQALTQSTPAAAEARSSGEKHIAAAVVPHSKAEQIACINNLKQIGLAARIWSNDEGGHLPKDFISLQKTLQNAGCLICPGDTANKQYANSSWADMDVKHISYQMVSPGAAETEPQKVYVRCPIHGIAAFADGSVQPEPPKQPAPPPPNHTVVAHSELKTARVAAPPSVPAIPHVEAVESLSRGLLDEEINNDPEQAAKKYQEIVNRFDQQRLEAGKAIFRLAECYRKLGRRDEAVVQYSRILREFVDQTDLARASQQQITPLLNQTARNRRIASTGIRLPVAPTVPIAPPMAIDPASGRHLIGESVAADTSMTAAEAKAQQANLLRAEINLLRSQLEQTREKFKAGVVSQEDTLKLEREMLALQRQLTALLSPKIEELNLGGLEKPVEPKRIQVATTAPKSESIVAHNTTQSANGVQQFDYQNNSEYTALARELERIDHDLQVKQTKAREMEEKFRNTQWLLDTVRRSTNVATLPTEVETDGRYRQLKGTYENIILESAGKEDAESQKKIEASLAKLKTWLDKIYLPELQANMEHSIALWERSSEQVRRVEDKMKSFQSQLDKVKESIIEKAKKSSTNQRF